MQTLDDVLVENGCEGASYFTGDTYDTAILGCTEDGRVVYSYEKMVEWLMQRDGMSDEDAQEWIQYNTIRAIPYMPNPPIIVYALIQ